MKIIISDDPLAPASSCHTQFSSFQKATICVQKIESIDAFFPLQVAVRNVIHTSIGSVLTLLDFFKLRGFCYFEYYFEVELTMELSISNHGLHNNFGRMDLTHFVWQCYDDDKLSLAFRALLKWIGLRFLNYHNHQLLK